MTPADGTRLTRRRLVALGGAAAAGIAAARASAHVASPRTSGRARAEAAGRFATQPTWSLPPVVVGTHAAGTAAGFVFVAPISFSSTEIPPGRYGPLIVDDEGEPVWFLPLATVLAQNFRVQKYRDAEVLTWYEGASGGTYGGSLRHLRRCVPRAPSRTRRSRVRLRPARVPDHRPRHGAAVGRQRGDRRPLLDRRLSSTAAPAP